MGINSRSKGKAGELEWAKWLRNRLGISEARRGQQFQGGADSPDVLGIGGIHFEVKRVERINLDKAMDQASGDCGIDAIPVVAHRRNRRPWMITILADDIPQFILAMEAAICHSDNASQRTSSAGSGPD